MVGLAGALHTGTSDRDVSALVGLPKGERPIRSPRAATAARPFQSSLSIIKRPQHISSKPEVSKTTMAASLQAPFIFVPVSIFSLI
jgi:hypothetical protein